MKKLSSFLVDIASVLFSFCVVLAFTGVIFRKVLNNSIVWSEEVIRYCFIWLFFLAMPEVTRVGGHLALDLLPSKLSDRSRRILLIIIEAICIVFDSFVVFYGVKLSHMNMSQFTASLRLPYGLVYYAIPTGALIMLAFSVRRIILLAKGREENA